MESYIRHYIHKDGKRQRVQCVRFEDWKDLSFLHPRYDPRSFDDLCDLYIHFTIPKYPLVFGTIVFFRLPEDLDIPFPKEDREYGVLYDPLSVVRASFQRHIALEKGELVFDDPSTEDFFHELEKRGCLKIAQGKRKTLSFHPVGRESGYLSQNETDASLRVNASFFLMDLLDLGSIYDHAMTPFGFAVKDGTVLQPPCFGREVLKVYKDGSVSVGKTDLNDLKVLIDGKEYIHGQNCHFYSRPEYKRSPKGGSDLIVSLKEVVAFREGGNATVPSSGFLIHLDHDPKLKDHHVSYRCDEDLLFAIQTGNSAVINGKKTETFLSPFYHFLRPWAVSYPPSFYPLNYEKDRAPRIVLGADKEGKPMLVWFEGAGKFGYDPEKDSAGASLSEAADICLDLGMYNGIHLDGGGSAEILLGKERVLQVSDRNEKDFSEKERAVPLGLVIR